MGCAKGSSNVLKVCAFAGIPSKTANRRLNTVNVNRLIVAHSKKQDDRTPSRQPLNVSSFSILCKHFGGYSSSGQRSFQKKMRLHTFSCHNTKAVPLWGKDTKTPKRKRARNPSTGSQRMQPRQATVPAFFIPRQPCSLGRSEAIREISPRAIEPRTGAGPRHPATNCRGRGFGRPDGRGVQGGSGAREPHPPHRQAASTE